MDVHPDNVMPTTSGLAPLRVDAPASNRDETALQLRARLLKLIVDNEKARRQSTSEPSKPR